MFTEQWSRMVSASVAPVVIISASALLCLAFYNRLAAIVARFRAVQRERLELHARLESNSAQLPAGAALRETCIMESLSEQTIRILRRARLIRDTLLSLLTVIALLVISSLLNGVAIFWPGAAIASAVFFVAGMSMLLTAVACAAAEVILALGPAEMEAGVVSELIGFPTGEATSEGDERRLRFSA